MLSWADSALLWWIWVQNTLRTLQHKEIKALHNRRASLPTVRAPLCGFWQSDLIEPRITWCRYLPGCWHLFRGGGGFLGKALLHNDFLQRNCNLHVFASEIWTYLFAHCLVGLANDYNTGEEHQNVGKTLVMACDHCLHHCTMTNARCAIWAVWVPSNLHPKRI